MSMKIGDLAVRTGVSVRTLRHYEELGLIDEPFRTQSGHRLYEEDSVARVQKVVALKKLGMPLEEIRSWVTGEQTGLLDVIRLQRARVTDQMVALAAIARRLELIDNRMSDSEKVSVDEILDALEAVTMFEKYYTEEQLKQLEERRIALGEETMTAVQQEWPELIAKVKAAKEAGVDPKSEEVQALARRWQELIAMFTGGDPGIRESLQKMYAGEPAMREKAGVDSSLTDYLFSK